jgi:asparagine synthase (glutamine-hydrolysing)
MGGIAGILGIPSQQARPAMERMLRALSHRGSYASNTHVTARESPDLFLATVLSIPPDRSPTELQPKEIVPPGSPLSVHHLAWDGEVYNSQAVGETLGHAGYPCRTPGNADFLLQAYRAWGTRCVERFQGTFAICLADPDRGQVWFCRDRLGAKSLYLTQPSSGGLLFASELRTLLAAGPELVPPTISPSAMESLLSQGAVFGMASIVENVQLLAPGESLVTDWSGRHIAAKSYWRIPFVPEQASTYIPNPSSRARAVQSLLESLRYAVKLSTTPQTPVGLLLSGGFHSAVLAAIASSLSSQPVQTFHVAFNGSGSQRSQSAMDVAAKLGTTHQTIHVSMEDVLASLPQVLAATDQPNVCGFLDYQLTKAARRAGFSAAVSAIGGDGFVTVGQQASAIRRSLRLRKALPYFGIGKSLVARLLDQFRRTRKLTAEGLRRDPTLVSLYLLRRELFRPGERRHFFNQPRNSDPMSGLSHDVMLDLTLNCSGMDDTNQIGYIEYATLLRNVALRDADVFGSANGVELRMPILDHLVVEQVAGMPGFLKSPRSYARSLLADAVGSRLGPLTHAWPTRAQVFPWDEWLRGPLRQRIGHAMEDRELWKQLGCVPDAAANAWRRFLANDPRVTAKQIVTLMVLEDFAKRHGLKCGGDAVSPVVQANSVAG